MSNVILFGDSMLARFRKPDVQQLERELGSDTVVFNCATGGFDSDDGVTRAATLGSATWSTVVLSFGANDCAPWKHVPLDRFTENIATILSAFGTARPVAFLPPVVRERDLPGLGRRTNAELDAYRDVLRAAVGPRASVETSTHIGTDGLEDDGLHLTPDSYEKVIPVLAKVIAGLAWRGARRSPRST